MNEFASNEEKVAVLKVKLALNCEMMSRLIDMWAETLRKDFEDGKLTNEEALKAADELDRSVDYLKKHYTELPSEEDIRMYKEYKRKRSENQQIK